MTLSFEDLAFEANGGAATEYSFAFYRRRLFSKPPLVAKGVVARAGDGTQSVVVTKDGEYLCRKVLIACGLLHFPRKLPVLDALESKSVFYKVPKIGDYDGRHVVVVGGGDSALDAAVMALERHAKVDVVVREDLVHVVAGPVEQSLQCELQRVRAGPPPPRTDHLHRSSPSVRRLDVDRTVVHDAPDRS